MAKNLWGDLGSLETVRTPKLILEEQARLLTDATGGMLVGAIDDNLSPGRFRYDLNVVVPALNNYAYTILTVIHPLELYPLRLMAERPKLDFKIGNEEDFEGAIAGVLSSPEVRLALSRLKSQVS